MIKAVLSITLVILGYIGCWASAIWAVVEFILFLAKDHPFNWWSLVALAGSILISVVCLVVIAVSEATKAHENKTPYTPLKSNFQKRLEALSSEQKNNKA